MLDRMDREDEVKGMSRTLTLSAKPSEIFRQHMDISFQEEAEGGLRRIAELGVDNIIGAADYPPPRSLLAALTGVCGHAPGPSGRGGQAQGHL